MRFRVDSQVWQVIDSTAEGDLAVLVVDGKATNRRGWFPCPQQTKGHRELPAAQLEDLPPVVFWAEVH
jgi:hypothetical protein